MSEQTVTAFVCDGTCAGDDLGDCSHESDRKQVQVEERDFIDVVFDGGPSAESGRFVEVEDPSGKSINAGEWIDRGDGLWALRIRPGVFRGKK